MRKTTAGLFTVVFLLLGVALTAWAQVGGSSRDKMARPIGPVGTKGAAA